ncbi:MAG: histidine--tRNA ligase [candidate division WOR-3 bacterium]|nr:histidine--tRNA ligase [candidate division WOR-3 bacterium]
MANVEPKVLRGFRDFMPGEMIARGKIINKIKEIYESYGFVPLATPALEYKEILLGYGSEASKQIYSFRDPEDNEVGLRFDLTVPLARVISQHKDLPRPFKRYQIQPVWRYDKPDPGRFREFIQFDIDTVGTDSMVADAEIVSAMYDCLNELGLNFKIRFSNRKVLNSLLVFASIDTKLAHSVFRVMDKLEKHGLENVRLELGPGRVDDSGTEILGLGLKDDQIAKIEVFLNLSQGTRHQAIDSLKELFRDTPGSEEGISELEEIHKYLKAVGVPDEKAAIDLSIARGLDYYTGPVFEAILLDAPRFGSVMGGGRFDKLIGVFVEEEIPATGASIGVDRLLSAMKHLEKIEMRSSVADILITVMVPNRLAGYLEIAKELRAAGFKAELYMGKERSISKQLKYADRQGIPLAIIIGPDEFEKNEVSIKDLRGLEQKTEKIPSRVEWIKSKPGQVTLSRKDLLASVSAILTGL